MLRSMRSLILSLVVVSISVTAFPDAAKAAWLWSPESGKWTNAKDVPKDAPNEQFNLGKAYFDEEDYARAVDEFNKLIKHYPNSRWAAEGEFHKGVAYERMGDIGKAAESFKILIDRYPYSDRLNDAVEHEFELAEAMLDGKKTKFLGMAIIPAEDTAADAYRHIVRRAPYGPYGAVAQYRLADAELVQGNFDEAERAYQAVIDEYPNSEYAPKAKYKIAQVSYKAALNEEHHLVKTEDALSKYASFKRAYPESYLQFEADDAIQALRQKKAHDIYDIAFFYQERKKYNSAKVYYNDVLGKFADTGVAEIAQQRMEEIDILEEGGSLPQRRILGVFPVRDRRNTAEEPTIEEASLDGRKPRSFLGIIPLGYEDEPTEEVTAEKDTRRRKSFLGIIPLGYEDEPTEEAQTEEETEQQPFLGLFV